MSGSAGGAAEPRPFPQVYHHIRYYQIKLLANLPLLFFQVEFASDPTSVGPRVKYYVSVCLVNHSLIFKVDINKDKISMIIISR